MSSPVVYLEDVVITAADTAGTISYTDNTAVDGTYSLVDVVPGVYNISASKYGYTFGTYTNVVVGANQNLTGYNFSGVEIGTTTQDIDLSEGFQFVSTRIQTSDMDMEVMVDDLITDGTLDFVKTLPGPSCKCLQLNGLIILVIGW